MVRCLLLIAWLSISFGIAPESADGAVRVLSSTDIDLPGCTMEQVPATVGKRFKDDVHPYSAHLLAVRIR